MGAKLAKPRRTVVAVMGDGAIQMSMMELATLMQDGIDVKIIVLRNCRLGMVRELQDKQYGGRHCGTYLGGGNPDFVALCGAYGIPARLAASNAEAERYAAEMLAAKGPFVLVGRTDPDTPTV